MEINLQGLNTAGAINTGMEEHLRANDYEIVLSAATPEQLEHIIQEEVPKYAGVLQVGNLEKDPQVFFWAKPNSKQADKA